ncbi:MAG: hypothetical protein NWE95_05900 [Candidatus Bathyarchaeota archaeon]|nr:hypothetical protein [Candidatus Bathyarchaeota archaeon]
MTKKISLEISDETYQKLSELGDFYKQDLKQTLAAILNAVGNCQGDITSLNSMYGQTDNLEIILLHAFRRYPALLNLVNQLLEKVEGTKGDFDLDTDVEFSFDGDYFRICFDANNKNPLCIHRVDFIKQDGLYCFSTNTYISSEETSEASLEKLEAIASDVDDPFDSESFNVEVDRGIEEPGERTIWTLTIDCWEECLDALPKMKQVDKLIKRILKRAGVTLKSQS